MSFVHLVASCFCLAVLSLVSAKTVRYNVPTDGVRDDSQYNFLAYRLNISVFKQVAKLAEDTDLNDYMVKMKPITNKQFDIRSIRIKSVVNETFDVELREDTQSIYVSAGIDRIVAEMDIVMKEGSIVEHIILGGSTLTVTLTDFRFSAELFVEYSSGVAWFNDKVCDLTYGELKVGAISTSLFHRLIVDAARKAACGHLKNSMNKKMTALDATMRLAPEKGIKANFFFHANKVTIGKDFIMIVYKLFTLRPQKTRNVVSYSPLSMPKFSASNNMVSMALGEGMFTELIRTFPDKAMGEISGTVSEYLRMRTVYAYFPESQRIYPNATLEARVTDRDISVRIRPDMMSIQLNVTVDLIARTDCKSRNLNTSSVIFTMDMNADIPVQIKFNDTIAKMKLFSVKGNVTIRNSSIGSTESRDFIQVFTLFPKVLYGSLFKFINKMSEPIQLKPLAHLPKSVVVKDTHVMFIEGAMIVTEQLEEMRGNYTRPIQKMRTYGNIYDIRETGLYVTSANKNHVNEIVACAVGASSKLVSSLVVLLTCLILQRKV